MPPQQTLALKAKRDIVAAIPRAGMIQRGDHEVTMNCPHCQQTLPENYTATFCCHCGSALAESVDLKQPVSPVKTNWWIFFGALLGPPLLTLLCALVGSQHAGSAAAIVVGLFGGMAGGIVCGSMLGMRLGMNFGSRFIIGFLLSGVMIVVCVTLCLFGCGIGGENFRYE